MDEEIDLMVDLFKLLVGDYIVLVIEYDMEFIW